MFKTLVGCCLEGFGCGPGLHMIKSVQNGPFSTQFRDGFGRVTIFRIFWKSGRILNPHTPRRVLLEGLWAGAC